MWENDFLKPTIKILEWHPWILFWRLIADFEQAVTGLSFTLTVTINCFFPKKSMGGVKL